YSMVTFSHELAELLPLLRVRDPDEDLVLIVRADRPEPSELRPDVAESGNVPLPVQADYSPATETVERLSAKERELESCFDDLGRGQSEARHRRLRKVSVHVEGRVQQRE